VWWKIITDMILYTFTNIAAVKRIPKLNIAILKFKLINQLITFHTFFFLLRVCIKFVSYMYMEDLLPFCDYQIHNHNYDYYTLYHNYPTIQNILRCYLLKETLMDFFFLELFLWNFTNPLNFGNHFSGLSFLGFFGAC
jgi:hypothetical protein